MTDTRISRFVPEVTVLDASHEVFFGAVPTSDVVSAVVRRLRAAIGLGFLAEGDRLPKESELAAQFEVTSFSLREALAILRDEGVITTRSGKNGGSFVGVGVDIENVASNELCEMSASELRDFGDWRQMLSSVSASLAAQRATESSTLRLRKFAEELGSSKTEIEARRAHCRFHVELAAAAQSARICRAEFAVYEEFDWLISLVLADPQRRRDSARELSEIAQAVARAEPDAARLAAEKHSASMASALMTLRLTLIARQVSGEKETRYVEQSHSLSDELRRIFSVVTDLIDPIVEEVQQILSGGATQDDIRSRMSTTVMTRLLHVSLPVHGLGFMAAPGALLGREFSVNWWIRTPQGVVVDNRHVTQPDRDDFYDYVDKEYFIVPRTTSLPWAQGPYVDYGGVNDYIVTFSSPIIVDGRFVGVVAADMQVSALERHLAPWLAAESDECVLLNSEGRVIVSRSVGHAVGDVLPSNSGRQLNEIGHFGWRME